MDRTPRCRDCDEEMEYGYVPDVAHGAVVQANWHPEEPDEIDVFWAKGKGLTRVVPTRMIPLRAWRCPECGEVRFFAIPRPPRKHDP